MTGRGISVVIPTYNRSVLLEQALQSLLRQQRPSGRVEVLVVDDGSTDGGTSIRLPSDEEWITFRRITQPHRGPCAARNRGAAETCGDVVAFLDDDCLTQEDWLRTIETIFDTGGCDVAAGRAIGLPAASLIGSYCRDAGLLERPKIGPGPFEFFVAANVAFRRAALEVTGGFDETFAVPGGEEVEMCFRLRAAGQQIVFYPEMAVFHRYRETTRALWQTYFRYGAGQWVAMQKGGRPLSVARLLAETIVIALNVFHLPLAYGAYRRQGVPRLRSLLYPLLDKGTSLTFRAGAITTAFRR